MSYVTILKAVQHEYECIAQFNKQKKKMYVLFLYYKAKELLFYDDVYFLSVGVVLIDFYTPIKAMQNLYY